jgi:hypothetical protein
MWIYAAVVALFMCSMLPGIASADAIGGFSDSLTVVAGGVTQLGQFVLEAPGETGFFSLGPLIIDLLDPSGVVSDRVTINIFGTITSDNNPRALSPTPNAITISGESATLFEVRLSSDADPTQVPSTSDTFTTLIKGFQNIVFAPQERSATPPPLPETSGFFTSGTGLPFDFVEPNGNIGDNVVLNIAAMYASDDGTEAGLPPEANAIQLTEGTGEVSLFSVAFESDIEPPPPQPVPEPSIFFPMLGVNAGLLTAAASRGLRRYFPGRKLSTFRRDRHQK